MKRAALALLLSLNSMSAWGASSNTCSNAIQGFNRGISQLVDNVRSQANQWVVYSDLDSLDELGFYLQENCDTESLDLISAQAAGQGDSQERACGHLVSILGRLVEQQDTPFLKGNSKDGLALSQEALGVGNALGSGCEVRLVELEDESSDESDAAEWAGEEWAGEEWSHGENVLVLASEDGEGALLNEEALNLNGEDFGENLILSSTEGEWANNELNAEGELWLNEEALNLHGEDFGEDLILSSAEGEWANNELNAEGEWANDEWNAEGEELLVNNKRFKVLDFYEVAKSGDDASGKEWQNGSYDKYIDPQQWQEGGYKRYYNANNGGNGKDKLTLWFM